LGPDGYAPRVIDGTTRKGGVSKRLRPFHFASKNLLRYRIANPAAVVKMPVSNRNYQLNTAKQNRTKMVLIGLSLQKHGFESRWDCHKNSIA